MSHWADYANATLPYLILASFLGAIAITRRRRHIVLAISLSTLVMALLELAGLRALRPAVLNAVQDAAYRPAVNVVYSAIVHSFNDMVVSVLVVSAIIFVLTLLLTGPGRLAKQIKVWIRWDQVRGSRVAQSWSQIRNQVRRYKPQILGGGAIVVLVILAFWAHISWISLTRAVLGYLIFVAVVTLLVVRRARKS